MTVELEIMPLSTRSGYVYPVRIEAWHVADRWRAVRWDDYWFGNEMPMVLLT